MKNTNKKTGYIVIALGLVLLFFTFYLAVRPFLEPEFLEPFKDLVEMNREGIAGLVDVLIFLIPAILLFVMGSIGGKVVHYGIKLVRIPDFEEDRRDIRKPKTRKKKAIEQPVEEEATFEEFEETTENTPKEETPPPPPEHE